MSKKGLPKLSRDFFTSLIGYDVYIFDRGSCRDFTQFSAVSKAMIAGYVGQIVWPADEASL